jgi:hypothetical protein
MKTWDEMTKRERRVAVANDVIKHLDRLNIEDGYGFIVTDEVDILKDRTGPITHEDCDTIRDTCTMCARGALMISKIDIFNSIDWSIMDIEYDGDDAELVDRDVTDDVLLEFGKKQLAKIESAFETAAYYAQDAGCSDATAQLCKEFGLKYKHPKDRLRAIMSNIVENGKFKPTP